MNKQYMSNFTNNLKELIGDMYVNEFSKKDGIPQQTLSRYINMQREITLDNLCKIADYFDEDIDVLLGRKNY